MEHFRPPIANPNWLAAVFDAKVCGKGGVLRRAVRDVNREVGREAFTAEVRRRGWHLVESGGQYIVICNQGDIRILC